MAYASSRYSVSPAVSDFRVAPSVITLTFTTKILTGAAKMVTTSRSVNFREKGALVVEERINLVVLNVSAHGESVVPPQRGHSNSVRTPITRSMLSLSAAYAAGAFDRAPIENAVVASTSAQKRQPLSKIAAT